MAEQRFSARRCRDTRKPMAGQCPDTRFFLCRSCGAVFTVTEEKKTERAPRQASEKGSEQTPEKSLEQGRQILCCGRPAEPLIPSEKAAEAMGLSYEITGGYNDNAVRVYWKPPAKGVSSSVSPLSPALLPAASAGGLKPRWIYLKTFTGGYLKYTGEQKKPPLVFALADTDAFAYCDEDPCLECVFRCKRGFMIYGYSEEAGLAELPLDKMHAQWQTGAE